MKYESDFSSYLKTVKISSKTRKPFSTKVASDTISRCKIVERALEIELSGRTLGSDAAAKNVCGQIKDAKISSTEARPYAHNELILAVRAYREFLAWFDTH
jgi:hypothetical protein